MSANLPAKVKESRTPTLAIELRSIDDLVKFATMVANSNFVPKELRGKPDEVAAVILAGHEIGIPPMRSLQSISPINGRPALWGDEPLALVYASGLVERFHEDIQPDRCVCIAKRKGLPDEVRREWTVETAKRAGLWGKPGSWTQFPQRMLQLRARAWALRDLFPDVLKGIAIGEELVGVEVMEAPTADAQTEPAKPKRGVAAVKAAVTPVEPEPQSDESAVEAPKEESQPKGRKLEPLIVLEPDGSPGSSVMTATAWLGAYRARMQVIQPEQRAAMAARNLAVLRDLAARAQKRGHESAAEFERELEAAEALAAAAEDEPEQPELLA